MSPIYTQTGDEGSTGLLGEGRVPKFDLRIEALGALDEATAALGLARASANTPEIAPLIVEVQRDLYKLMAEVGATPENAAKFRSIDEKRVKWLEAQADAITAEVEVPREFILPGEVPSSAAMGLARTIIRRAERRVVELHHAGGLENLFLLAYLNRLSSLCFALELLENREAGQSTKMAKEKWLVLAYRGGISLLAAQLNAIVSTSMMNEMTTTGGVLLMGIGVSSLLELKKRTVS